MQSPALRKPAACLLSPPDSAADAQLMRAPWSATAVPRRAANEYSYKNVERWTKPKGRLKKWKDQFSTILDCDLIIMPVHLGVHWTCAIISLRDQELWYCDSMSVSAGSRPAWRLLGPGHGMLSKAAAQSKRMLDEAGMKAAGIRQQCTQHRQLHRQTHAGVLWRGALH